MYEDEKKIRETGELASAWYGDRYDDEDDAVDIKRKRQRTVTELPYRALAKVPEKSAGEAAGSEAAFSEAAFSEAAYSEAAYSEEAYSKEAYSKEADGKGAIETRPMKTAQTNTTGTRPVNTNGARPINPNGTRPVNPNAARPMNPNAARPMNPNAARPVNPNAARPVNPNGARPANPNSARPANPNSARPVNPNGARPVNPNVSRSVNPNGTRPLNPNGVRPVNPNGTRSVNPNGARPTNPNAARPASGARPNPNTARPASSTRPASSARSAPAARPASGSLRLAKPAKVRRDKVSVGCVIRRSLLVFFTVILFAVGVLLAVCNTLANGPSETARDKAVMSALQASAVKWAPGLFLTDDVVEQIKQNSTVVNTDVRPIGDVGGEDGDDPAKPDRWANAVDGMYYETINGKTFKGYVLFIKDPSRVSVATWDKSFASTERIFEVADKYQAVAAINGGEFPDNGVQTGTTPMGLTYIDGECVWDDGYRRTFFGFTKENKLFVGEGTTRAEADAMGIRDAVAFQNGNTLITNDGENVTYYYADSNTGVAQRTAIAQLADGTVIFLVTDGRTASSMGATKNDIIDVLADYGAVTAGLLDGGSSSLLYYRDYYDIYGLDKSKLDEWQLMGLVNKYKAFTNPRRIPTYFIVK